MGFSPRYPPVAGRLHTRYAPVRRSPPGYCYPALPLDLHVLGLPLAFILSQDQTLRCLKACRLSPQKGPQRVCLCFIVLSGVISTAPRALAPKQHPCTLLCMLLLSCCPSRQRTRGFRRLSLLPAGSRALSSLKNSLSSLPLSLNRLVRSRKRVQRYSCFPPPPNFLTTFFQKKYNSLIIKEKIFRKKFTSWREMVVFFDKSISSQSKVYPIFGQSNYGRKYGKTSNYAHFQRAGEH